VVWTLAGEAYWYGGRAETVMCYYAILDETPADDARPADMQPGA
jgi:hypothetical protein